MKKSKKSPNSKKGDVRRVMRFLEDFSWLMDSYSDVDFTSTLGLIQESVEKSSEAKTAVGSYESSNPNKHFLVGVLPRLLTDETLFPTNDDIAQFAFTVMDVTIPRHQKKSKYEIIGHIVCQTNKLDDSGLTKLVRALATIARDDKGTKELIKKRKKENFGWNAIIQELASVNGHA